VVTSREYASNKTNQKKSNVEKRTGLSRSVSKKPQNAWLKCQDLQATGVLSVLDKKKRQHIFKEDCVCVNCYDVREHRKIMAHRVS
jgi:hypothetical protein